MASFVSSKDLEVAREEKRRARDKLLREEEDKFLAKQEAKRRHKESGNDRWMLPGIEKRLETEASKFSEVTSGKKSKKSKKKKKRKKKESSSESSGSDSEGQWEEKPTFCEEVKLPAKGGTNWLNFDDIISGNSTYTSKSIKEQKEAEKAASKVNDDDLTGKHPRELNPYWKEGGTGLPSQERTSESKRPTNKVNKEWLLRSLKRMTEQAKELDRSIESIAAERYGSWQEFQSLLRQAEPERGRDSHRRGYHRDQSKGKSGMTFMRPKDDDEDESYSRHSHKRQDRKESSKRHKYDRQPAWKKNRERSRSPYGEERRKSDRSPSPRRSIRPSWKKADEKSAKNDSKDQRNRSLSPESRHDPSFRKKNNTESSDDRAPLKKSPRATNYVNNDDEKTAHRFLGPKRLSSDSSQLSSSSKQEASSEMVHLNKSPEEVVKLKENTNSKAPEQKPIVLSEKEKNQLAAKILKAELMGNDKLASTLKAKLEKARSAESAAVKNAKIISKPTKTQEDSNSESSEEETVVLTRVGKDGQSWPLQHSDMAYGSLPNKKRKKTKVPTHARDGKRERYFADDDRHSLEDLVRREKTEEAEDQHAMFSRLASKQFQGTDSEYFTLDDMYVSEASRKNTRTEEEVRQKQKAISEHKKLAMRLEKCRLCFGNPELPKHLLIAIGKKCYLALPDHKPLTEGHCIIAPMHHCNTGTALDEDVWAEVRQFMRALQDMFKFRELDCVFMQTCMGLKKSRHFFVDCIPLPNEEGDMAPIYFKKAIQESESEWSHNKKLIDTRGKDVQKCVPKGLPYFSVEFGMDGGFAHVVEDEALFPFYFGREIVGGMLDVEPRLWRHPPKDHFSEQTKRSVKFSEWWKPHDWTAGISGTS